MTDAEAEALARDVFRLVSRRLNREGLSPQDDVVGRIFATLIGGYFAMRAATLPADEAAPLARELLELVAEAMHKAETLLKEAAQRRQ